MYELIQAGARTYYINCPAKIGVYQINDSEVCLIDSGNDKDAGKKVLRILEENGWSLAMILNTHSHADHIGGNLYLQQKTGCAVYAPEIEAAFVQYPVLEPSYLYGGFPCKELRNKFLLAASSTVQPLREEILPKGLTMLRLDGHSFSMSAFKTSDDVWFLADCLTGENILQKYHISFLYDVEAYVQTLETVCSLQAKLFIPSHAEPTTDIVPLAAINLKKTEEIIALLPKICMRPLAFDDILQAVFEHYALTMDWTQYVLVGSTIRSYLSYLQNRKILDTKIVSNKLCWCVTEQI